MARQHGYFILIPAFIPVDKKSLQNQIQTGTVIHEAAQTQDLAAIMALPGIRYHASKTRDGAPKELHSRWGSVEVEAVRDPEFDEPAADDESFVAISDDPAPMPVDEPLYQSTPSKNGKRGKYQEA